MFAFENKSHMYESCLTQMSRVTSEWVMSPIDESCQIWMSHVSHKWVMSQMNTSCHTYAGLWELVTHVGVMSHTNESCHIYLTQMSRVTYKCIMGWLRLVGSLKLCVSFAEYSFFYRALLQKRPMILRSLLILATPYVTWMFALENFSQMYESCLTQMTHVSHK